MTLNVLFVFAMPVRWVAKEGVAQLYPLHPTPGWGGAEHSAAGSGSQVPGFEQHDAQVCLTGRGTLGRDIS